MLSPIGAIEKAAVRNTGVYADAAVPDGGYL